MPGTKPIKILLDSDALIAFLKADDLLHLEAVRIFEQLAKPQNVFYIASTTLAEVITVLQRKFSNRQLAESVYERLIGAKTVILGVEAGVLDKAFKVFIQSFSKRNTFFDAVNIAVFREYRLDAIASFDSWYQKQKVKLVKDLLR